VSVKSGVSLKPKGVENHEIALLSIHFPTRRKEMQFPDGAKEDGIEKRV